MPVQEMVDWSGFNSTLGTIRLLWRLLTLVWKKTFIFGD